MRIINSLGFYIPNTLHNDALLHGIYRAELSYGDSSMVTIRENEAVKEVLIWHT